MKCDTCGKKGKVLYQTEEELLLCTDCVRKHQKKARRQETKRKRERAKHKDNRFNYGK